VALTRGRLQKPAHVLLGLEMKIDDLPRQARDKTQGKFPSKQRASFRTVFEVGSIGEECPKEGERCLRLVLRHHCEGRRGGEQRQQQWHTRVPPFRIRELNRPCLHLLQGYLLTHYVVVLLYHLNLTYVVVLLHLTIQ
jgi:hypothetical protein